MFVTGEVTAVSSRWTEDGTRIITEATVETDGGAVVVSQFGGTVDGLTMRSFPGPDPLVLGMRVTVQARQAFDLSARSHNVVDAVKVIAMPPGYVRTGPTKAGEYLRWESGCVFLTVDAGGTKDVAGDIEFAAVDRSIAAWNIAAGSCSYLELVTEARRAIETGRDNVNIIKFRDVSWCRPATPDDPARCHPDSAAGITTATYVDDAASDRDGAIVDADIELNAVNFAIAVDGQTNDGGGCVAEVQNTLTHEIGHLLGLEHTCLASGDPARIDHRGESVPSCAGTNDPAILASTMYNFQECGEADKSSLAPDDVAAICGIYPIASDPGTCEAVGEGGGCCQAGSAPGGALALWVLVAVVLFRSPFWRPRRD